MGRARMLKTVQKAANDVDECKQMLVKMQRQLDKIEEKQEEMVRAEAMQDGSEDEKMDKTGPIPFFTNLFQETSSSDSEGSSDADYEEEESLVDSNEDEESLVDDSNEEEEEAEKGSTGNRSKVALAAMAGGAILMGGALQRQLRSGQSCSLVTAVTDWATSKVVRSK